MKIEIDAELTIYRCRHAFALRLAKQMGVHLRAAELMSHSPATPLRVYGRRLDQPALLQKVRERVLKTANKDADRNLSKEKTGQ